MTKNFPTDEIDSVPAGIGRRRARRSKGAAVLEFFTYLSVSAVLAGSALFGYQTFFGGGTKLDLSALSDNNTSTQQSADPLRINETTVYDAVGQDGLASGVARKLLDKGWNVVTASDMPLGAKSDKTVVYINSQDLDAAAKALVADLGQYSIEVSNQYIDPIVVVLGADYK
jgi:hypothetical protein